jgi:hypothetical protein
MHLGQSEGQVGEQETWLVTLQSSRKVKDLEKRFDAAIDRLLKRFFSLQMADELNDRKVRMVTSKG